MIIKPMMYFDLSSRIRFSNPYWIECSTYKKLSEIPAFPRSNGSVMQGITNRCRIRRKFRPHIL